MSEILVIDLWGSPPDEFGPCYECRDGNHEGCVGVPCGCDCPNGQPVSEEMPEPEEEDANRRMLACLDACEGLPTEILEAGFVADLLEYYVKASSVLRLLPQYKDDLTRQPFVGHYGRVIQKAKKIDDKIAAVSFSEDCLKSLGIPTLEEQLRQARPEPNPHV